jgi:tRNA A-37 threonylcarbamoyl transferase component Bud32
VDELDERIAELCRAGDLVVAARLLAAARRHLRASALFEQACEFARASEQAELAGDRGLAVRMAVLSGDAALAEGAVARLVAACAPEVVSKVAADLSSRGHARHAALALEAIGDLAGAGAAFELAGAVVDASRCFDAAGQPAQAARLLEAALKAGSADDPDALRAVLGPLYARHGKHQAAVRVLQQLRAGSAERKATVGVLARSLEALGLMQARRDLEAELAAAGGIEEPEARTETAVVAPEATLFGRYRVLDEIAVTPHARLVRAVDQLSGEAVAVKIFAGRGRGTGRDALSRFVREAKALTQLRHPNVVPLREFLPDVPAMVLAWMGGGSLADLLRREPVSPARAVEITRAVLAALAEAHRLGILHRDIKPSNLLFDEGGAARLGDFGAAHLTEAETTVTVGAIGTVAYMAPEQRAGHAASVQSDIYSVGVLLFEMLTGRLPPQGRAASLVGAHPDLHEAHDAALQRFMARDAAERYATALDAARAIESTRSQRGLVSQPELPEERHSSERVGPPEGDGDRHDYWVARDVHVWALGDASLARAAALARAQHPSLATVLRVDTEAQEIWIEVVRGRPLAQGLRLDPAQVQALCAAVEALHRSGGVHGAIDAEHVLVADRTVRLAMPREAPPGSSAAGDTAQLDALLAAMT